MKLRQRRNAATVLALLAGMWLFASAAPAMARPEKAPATERAKAKTPKATSGKRDQAGSRKPAPPRPAVTEDNDNDGVRNAPDPLGDSDNRHPSGRDKHAEAGKSGNQGRARSAPDQDGHGPERDVNGTDKPDGPGGLDILDQDGNNGCGNDDDFEDDNEGLCGGPTRADLQESAADLPPAEAPVDSGTRTILGRLSSRDAKALPEAGRATVLSAELVASSRPAPAAAAALAAAHVLAAGFGVAGSMLPITGVAFGPGLLGGGMLAASGGLAFRLKRSRRRR